MELFYTRDKQPVTASDITKVLEQLKIGDAKYLYVHTGMNFGLPNPKLGRKALLEELFKLFTQFNIENILFPTFTFSFCNGDNYDVRSSRSKMGAINEYVRTLPQAIRSIDPLMSSVLVGKDTDLVQNLSKQSIGAGSTFDKLHNREDVKFLFFGTKIGDCFTYMHYIEKMVNSTYRYDRDFTGMITDAEGNTYEDTYSLFVRYRNVYAGKGSYVYEEQMKEKGISTRVNLGDASITVVDEVPAYEYYVDLITKDPNYFVDMERTQFDNDKNFSVKDMVAL